jgi:hypothetical protein
LSKRFLALERRQTPPPVPTLATAPVCKSLRALRQEAVIRRKYR